MVLETRTVAVAITEMTVVVMIRITVATIKVIMTNVRITLKVTMVWRKVLVVTVEEELVNKC